jgi:ABC-type sugar transport system permease subunit
MNKKLNLTPYLFLAPALIGISIFVLYPILAVIYYSFTRYNISSPPVACRLNISTPSLTASSAAGILTISVALVRMPASWAFATASFTPLQSPKSSAFIMIRLVIANKSKRQKWTGQSVFVHLLMQLSKRSKL